MAGELPPLTFRPLTPERWDDFERVMGPHGAYGGCWCMYWRTTRREFDRQAGEGNRNALRTLVDAGVVPGFIAYADGEPAGWCSVAPREEFESLERSPVLKRLDDEPVWSIVCFYIPKAWRSRGMLAGLVRGAVDYAQSNGATIVEAYPSALKSDPMAPVTVYMGVPEVYAACGFVEAARPSESRIVMRNHIGTDPPGRPG